MAVWNEVILPFLEYDRDGYSHPMANNLFIKTFSYFFSVSAEQVRTISYHDFTTRFREKFLFLSGIEFYNLINYVSQKIASHEHIRINHKSKTFANLVNVVFEEKGAPCRFTENNALTLITNPIELASVNEAMTTPYEATVNMHMKKAADALFRRNGKDCCDDAYSAIESLIKSKKGIEKSDFGKLIKNLKLEPALQAFIEKGWGFVSNRARHGQNDDNYIYPTIEEAKLILIISSGVINYLNTIL